MEKALLYFETLMRPGTRGLTRASNELAEACINLTGDIMPHLALLVKPTTIPSDSAIDRQEPPEKKQVRKGKAMWWSGRGMNQGPRQSRTQTPRARQPDAEEAANAPKAKSDCPSVKTGIASLTALMFYR